MCCSNSSMYRNNSFPDDLRRMQEIAFLYLLFGVRFGLVKPGLKSRFAIHCTATLGNMCNASSTLVRSLSGNSTDYRQQHCLQATVLSTGNSTVYRQQHCLQAIAMSAGNSTVYRQQHCLQATALSTGNSTVYRQQHCLQATALSTGNSNVCRQ